MDNLNKIEDAKDLFTLIKETSIIGIELRKYLEVLLQNIENLKDETYSNRIETYHLALLLVSIKKTIEEILEKGEVQQDVKLFQSNEDGNLILSVGRSYEDKINDDVKDKLTRLADEAIKSIKEINNAKNLDKDSN